MATLGIGGKPFYGCFYSLRFLVGLHQRKPVGTIFVATLKNTLTTLKPKKMLTLLVGFVTAVEDKVELPLFGKIDEDNAWHYFENLQDGQRPSFPSFLCFNVSV